MLTPLRVLAVTVACSIVSVATASATIVINIGAYLKDQNGANLAPNTLIQLVNLGTDGVFNPISLADGDVSAMGQWVTGDDVLLNVLFNPASSPDFLNSNAFDLLKGNDGVQGATPGLLDRAFSFSTDALTEGMKLGIRWFPGLLATEFQTITLAGTQRYGEFTRQTAPINGGDIPWVVPSEGKSSTFDSLIPVSNGGLDDNSKSIAAFTVPEPTAIAMSLVGAAGLAMLRRRRA